MSVLVEPDVLGEREVEDEPSPLPVFGDVPDALVEALARVESRVTSSPAMRTTPALGLRQARERVDQLGLTVAVDAREADDLSRAHLERDASHGRQAALVEDVQVLHLEQRLARLGRLLVHAEEHFASDHQLGQLLLGGALTREASRSSCRAGGP